MTLGTVFLIIIGVIAALILWGLMIYNRLLKLKKYFKKTYVQIDAKLSRRYALIPNLVEATRAYLSHERETLDTVVSATHAAASAMKAMRKDPTSRQAMQSLLASESFLVNSMLSFNTLTQESPELKSNASITRLQKELDATDNHIADAIQRYNDNVKNYNEQCSLFPDIILANMFKFEEAAIFEVPDATLILPMKVRM